MSKPDLKVIEGGKIETVDVPESKEFSCHKCGRSCVIYPRARPVAVQHSIPVCEEWQRIEAKKEDLERFAIKCGVELLLPQGDA